MKLVIIIIVIIMILSAFTCSFRKHWYHRTEMPPGWKLVINTNGRYACQADSGYVITKYYGSFRTDGMSKQQAINRAWYQYNYELRAAAQQKGWKEVE